MESGSPEMQKVNERKKALRGMGIEKRDTGRGGGKDTGTGTIA